MSEVRNMALAPEGHKKIEWARAHMPVLESIREEFEKEQPFKGLKVALSVHLEAKTAYLSKVMAAGGAEMYVTGSNPLSTQDDVAAALAEDGLNVHAWYASTPEEYHDHIRKTVSIGPDIVIDDGGDLVNALHTEFPELCAKVRGGCEETTTGVLRLVAMAKEGALKFPMMLVNDAQCKHLFDNRYGTGQSVWDGINRTTNLLVAGKTVVVCGYGWCGKGVALRAAALGARVVVTEIDPIKAIEARMDGYDVMPINEAAEIGDVFITVTGCKHVITEPDFLKMKDGAVMCNAGHFDVEVDVAGLTRIATEQKEQKKNIRGYKLPNGRWVSVLAEGRLVNLAAGDGHPVEIMDLSFAIQALGARYVAQNRLEPGVYKIPLEVDEEVARRKLAFDGCRIDTLTEEQKAYLQSWQAE